MAVRRYYQLLELPHAASQDEVKRAFRRLARTYHPDQNPGDDTAEERFKAIVEAYRVLGDVELRRVYDRYGLAPSGAAFADVPARINVSVSVTLRDIARRAKKRFTARRGDDIRMGVVLEFADAIRGTTRVFELPRRSEDRVIRARRLAFDLPPGLRAGQMLRWPGEGAPGADGGRPGDLLVDVAVSPHPVFRRRDTDIVSALPLTPLELHDGANVPVPTLWGPRRINVPPGAAPGDELRLPERGVPGTPPGDAVFVVQYQPPNLDDPAVRAAVQSVYRDGERSVAFEACLLECRKWST